MRERKLDGLVLGQASEVGTLRGAGRGQDERERRDCGDDS
jgi:hypothetical protein